MWTGEWIMIEGSWGCGQRVVTSLCIYHGPTFHALCHTRIGRRPTSPNKGVVKCSMPIMASQGAKDLWQDDKDGLKPQSGNVCLIMWPQLAAFLKQLCHQVQKKREKEKVKMLSWKAKGGYHLCWKMYLIPSSISFKANDSCHVWSSNSRSTPWTTWLRHHFEVLRLRIKYQQDVDIYRQS